MATHSSVLAWRIPGTGEPGGVPSVGSHRVGHNWSNLAVAIWISIFKTLYWAAFIEKSQSGTQANCPQQTWADLELYCKACVFKHYDTFPHQSLLHGSVVSSCILKKSWSWISGKVWSNFSLWITFLKIRISVAFAKCRNLDSLTNSSILLYYHALVVISAAGHMALFRTWTGSLRKVLCKAPIHTKKK